MRKWGYLLAVIGAVGCGETTTNEPSKSDATKPSDTTKRGVAFVGFDASPPLINALSEGKLQGIVVQNPYRMGQEAVKAMIAHLDGKTVQKAVSTGETLVTPDNMTSAAVDPLLNPPKADHSSGTSLTGTKSKKWRVLVIPKGTTHEFWKTIHAGALKAASDLGNVEIVWQGPQKEDDRTEQIKLVQNAVAARVDGIALAPLDSKALVKPVEDAIAAGIPVVIFDSGLESQKPISYVATDNYHGGVLAAERLAELLKGKGKIVLMRYMIGSESTEQREKGFTDTIAKHPGITYLSDNTYAGATSDTAQQTAQSLVTRFRGQVDGIFCPNESSTSGMLRALQDAGMLATRP
jgi:ribose transport system substrate-binding protein